MFFQVKKDPTAPGPIIKVKDVLMGISKSATMAVIQRFLAVHCILVLTNRINYEICIEHSYLVPWVNLCSTYLRDNVNSGLT